MTVQPKRKVWYDNYTKILHIGKIMIRHSFSGKFKYCRVDASKRPYLKLGVIDVRL